MATDASESKNCLGFVVNDMLSRTEPLHGNKKNTGLISHLKQRVGTLRRLSKFISSKGLEMMAIVIFTQNVSIFTSFWECVRTEIKLNLT